MEEGDATKAGRCSIGHSEPNNTAAGWALRASRSEYQLQSDDDVKNARITALLSEMRPKADCSTRRAHTTNLVSLTKHPEKDAIYGSWQDRRPLVYGSQQVSLPKYDQLYCNTSGMLPLRGRIDNASTSTLPIRKEPPEYSRLRPLSTWQLTVSESRAPQAGWLKNPRPLARGALSPASYFKELENKNGSIASGLAVAAAKITTNLSQSTEIENLNGSSSDSTLDSASENIPETANRAVGTDMTLNRSTPRQASFMAAIQRHPLKESTSVDTNGSETDSKYGDTQQSVSTTIASTPLRRPRGREFASGRAYQSSRSMGRLDFEALKSSKNDGDNKEVADDSVKMRTWNDAGACDWF
ncbi:unnamed protein product [Caenorhabditis bovis]|uniref:Uncharacterized protein n=1 Tax=Caenorhabditis bovis TaxID=2654633 RepID=A0A8S1EZQ7_9PELO|nr:unnamed protein product [Caenorhabditis bovis]